MYCPNCQKSMNSIECPECGEIMKSEHFVEYSDEDNKGTPFEEEIPQKEEEGSCYDSEEIRDVDYYKRFGFLN